MNSNSKFILKIGGALFLGLLVAVRISTFGNPEVVFWAKLFEEKDREISVIVKPKIVFVGGSSCTFSVDPEIVGERTGMSAYNYGGIAYMGPRYMFARVKEHLKAGDVLVVGYEPEILKGIDGEKAYPLGRRMALYNSELDLLPVLWTPEKNFQRWMEAVRPGLRVTVVSLGRALRGGRPYAYTPDDQKRGGRLELGKMEYQLPARKELGILPLEKSAIVFMRELVAFCQKNDITCVYTIPWQATDPAYVEENRKKRAEFLAEVGTVIPCLEDERVGVIAGMEGFSDSEYHLGPEMSRKRSEFLSTKLEKFFEENEFRKH